MRVFRLAVGKGERGFDGGAKRIFVNAVRGHAGGAAVHHGANGHIQAPLGNVLVDGVVGKARERFGGFVDVHFGFLGRRWTWPGGEPFR